jgi:hypothetical protein
MTSSNATQQPVAIPSGIYVGPGAGTVTSVTAANTTVDVAGTAAAPTVGVGTLVAGQGVATSDGGNIGLAGKESVNVVAVGGAAQTLAAPATDIGNDITLSANLTVTMPAGVRGSYCWALLRQASAGGPFTAAFTGVKWAAGLAPVMSAGASAVDLYYFEYDGTNWYGTVAGQAFA